jgi:hypothetical protein
MTEQHDEILREKKLARVGQTVRNKKDGTLWQAVVKFP